MKNLYAKENGVGFKKESTFVTLERGHVLDRPTSFPGVSSDIEASSPRRQKSIRSVNLPTKNTVLIVLLILLVGGFIYLGVAMDREFSRVRQLNDEQNRVLARLGDQGAKTDKQVAELAQSNQTITASRQALPDH